MQDRPAEGLEHDTALMGAGSGFAHTAYEEEGKKSPDHEVNG